jgi:hypothetical protein
MVSVSLKSPSSSAGFEPANLGSSGKHHNHYTTEGDKFILPSLHIILSITQDFVKVLDKNDEAFKYLGGTFPRISKATLKESIFKFNRFGNRLRTLHLTLTVS